MSMQPSPLTTGLWGFGWSAQVQDPWIAPAVFFGVIGFGCTLGSTVSVSFVVDSYRADAGSSLTSLNFSKNVLGTTHKTVPPTNKGVSGDADFGGVGFIF